MLLLFCQGQGADQIKSEAPIFVYGYRPRYGGLPTLSSRDTACLIAPEHWLNAGAGYHYYKCLYVYVMEITPSTRLSYSLPQCFHTDIGICNRSPGHSCKGWLELVQSDVQFMYALCVGMLIAKTAPHAQSCSGLYASGPSRRDVFDECITQYKKQQRMTGRNCE